MSRIWVREMRTEIQVNGILREYCSVTGRDGNANTDTRSLYHQDKFVKNGHNHDLSLIMEDDIVGYGKEEISKTILKHETIFRNQLRELHRLYIRQRELMNEMKRVKLNKDEHKIPFISLIQDTQNLTSSEIPLYKSIGFKKRTDSLEVPANVLGINVENQMQKSFYEFPVVETTSRNQNHQASCANSAFTGAWRPECKVDSSRPHYPTDLNLATCSADENLSSLSCLARPNVSANSGSTFHLASTNFYENPQAGKKGGICFSIMNLRNEICGKEHLSDHYTEEKRFEKHSFTGNSSFGKSQTCSKGGQAEPRNGFSDNHWSTCKSASRRKQTPFGVEISEENDDPLGTVSNMSSIIIKNVDETNAKTVENSKRDSENSHEFQMAVPQQNLVFTGCQSNQENLKEQLPWFLKTPQRRGEPKKEAHNSYFLNMDSLQNCSNDFFKKTKTTGGSLPTLKAKQETSESMVAQIADNGIPRTILSFTICNALHTVKNPNSGGNISKVKGSDIDSGGGPKEQLEIKDFVLQKGFNNYISGLRHRIDLNLTSEEEDAPPAPSIPTTIVKIATTEIDLEAPALIESEAEVPFTEADLAETKVPPRKSEHSNEDSDRIAAQTIISFLMSGKRNSNEVAREPLEATSSDCLKWFAEKILSNCDDAMRTVSLVQNGVGDAAELIAYGMDCFEFMTLKLKDTMEEHYSYKPMELNNPSDEETKRSRKGIPGRGRQLKDFQKDILPGLVTLSRQEVSEDLKTLERLLFKVEGGNSPRSGRGRKRFRVLATSPVSKSVYSTITQQPTCQKLGLEGRNILGWGKRTRRLPRQRCPNAHLSSPLK